MLGISESQIASSRGVYAGTILISAFLLFQVQPIIGKYILPWFGSSPGVWTLAVLFFQLLVLVGYGYAHFSSSRLSLRTQGFVHLMLLVCAVLLLPITPSDSWQPSAGDDPTIRILILLTVSVGGPFMLLASTSPLLQKWISILNPDASPYRLYAVSNFGSLLALLSYPFLIERFIPLSSQLRGWSTGFVVFALAAGLCVGLIMWKSRREPSRRSASEESTRMIEQTHTPVGSERQRPDLSQIIMWVALACCASIVMLATMNRMNQDVPAVPFMFVLPLSLYLLSFILTFDHPRWYVRRLFCSLLPLALGAAWYAINELDDIGVFITIMSAVLFVCCMTCHGELERLKPDAEHLTLFYLMVGLGGVLGGAFVAIVAPLIFPAFWEYELGLVASFGLVMWHVVSPSSRRVLKLVTVVAVGIAVISFGSVMFTDVDDVLARSRNFYGYLEVEEDDADEPEEHHVELMHGQIKHGLQFQSPAKRRWPTTYYGKYSGVGLAIENHPNRRQANDPYRLGVIGLGVGTLSTYANDADSRSGLQNPPNDFLAYYEINPQIVEYAEEFFTFNRDAIARNADVNIYMGDARLTLERQLRETGSMRYDVLAVDAFSGDAVPTHLLTKECFELYFSHLELDGILAVHISNRYVDLEGVLLEMANYYQKEALLVDYDGDDDENDANTWVLMTTNQSFLENERVLRVSSPLIDEDIKPVLWTDDYSSLFEVLK